MYLTKVAAEALAVKCPVLTGSWEAVVESVMTLSKSYKRQDYGAASDHFSTWIINAIGDPDICPTFSVRFDLMILLLNVVDFNDSNQTQAIRSLMFACSSIRVDNVIDLILFDESSVLAQVFETFAYII